MKELNTQSTSIIIKMARCGIRNEIADQNRAEKAIVDQMMHVKAPLAQASVAEVAQLAVEMIREVMKDEFQMNTTDCELGMSKRLRQLRQASMSSTRTI